MTDPTCPGGGTAGTGRRFGAARCLRLSLSGLMLAAAFLLGSANGWFRALETAAAGPLVRLCTGGAVLGQPSHGTVFVDLYTRRAFGLTITPECTAALPIAALLAVAGVVALSRRFPLPRIMAGLFVAAAGIFVVNELRLALIAWSGHEWGPSGYGWAHATVGSVVTIAGVSAAITVFFVISIRGGSDARPRGSEPPAEGV